MITPLFFENGRVGTIFCFLNFKGEDKSFILINFVLISWKEIYPNVSVATRLKYYWHFVKKVSHFKELFLIFFSSFNIHTYKMSTKEALLSVLSEPASQTGDKVTIVGIGQVGMACAFSILSQVGTSSLKYLYFLKCFMDIYQFF